MSIRVGIVGVSGFGGGEALRLCAAHPKFELVYVAGESSAGSQLIEKFPGLSRFGNLKIEKWNPSNLPNLDVLFASLPTGESKAGLAKVSPQTRICDIGGDHRFVEGWTYGLADVWPDRIRNSMRVANPGCYPSASIGAIAPLLAKGLIAPDGIIVNAMSGVSGAGRGGGSTFGFAEVNEDLMAYGFHKHAHVPEMKKALSEIAGETVSMHFTPHLVPITRGILSTCYGHGSATTEQCLEAAREYYADKPFVRVVEKPPHSKWSMGTNLLFVSYAADPLTNMIIAIGTIDNLGKGASGQAIQNANLMMGLPETTGLEATALWP